MKALIVCGIILLLLIGMSAAAVIYSAKKFKGKGRAYLAGFLSFFVMQLVIRIPLMQLLAARPDVQGFAAANPAMFAFTAALTAALFEGAGRLLFGWAFLRRALRPNNGVRMGVGHAVTEVLLIVGVAYINNLILAVIALSPDAVSAMIAQTPRLASVFAALRGPVGPFFWAAFERLVTLLAQVGMGIIALYALYKKSFKYVLLMLGLHTFIDSFGAFCVLLGVDVSANIAPAEAYIALTCLAVFIVGCRTYRKWRGELAAKASLPAGYFKTEGTE